MKTYFTLAICLFVSLSLYSQSNINQTLSVNSDGSLPVPSAQLDVQATDKGMLVPRMTSAQRTAIVSPATGLLVFDTTTGGFWFYNGTVWTSLSAPKTLADADGDTKIQVEESPDEDIIRFDLGGTESMVLRRNSNGHARLELPSGDFNTFLGEGVGNSNTTGASNTANGFQALQHNTTGFYNMASGSQALYFNTTGNSNVGIGTRALYYNTDRSNLVAVGDSALFYNGIGAVAIYSATANTALGSKALFSNTTGNSNTASGYETLFSNTAGFSNTALGSKSLFSNTTGFNNTVSGYRALYSNTQGFNNTASGTTALYSNTTGNSNTASGCWALYSNTTGNSNTASGLQSLASNTTGSSNTASGRDALYSNTTGNSNTASGTAALYSNTTGHSNVASGSEALNLNSTGNFNTASGGWALYPNTTQSSNTAVGYSAGDYNASSNSTFLGYNAYPSANGYSNCMALGQDARPTGSNAVHVGNTSIITIAGQVGFTTYSDRRFKQNISENVGGLDFILRLRPVTYNLDVQGMAGFLKEDFGRDKNGAFGPKTPDEETRRSREEKSKIRYTGFIAQEVAAAAAASGYDFSGVDKPQNETGLYGLRYAEFTVPLVKAVQEQQQIIENNLSREFDREWRMENLEKENAAKDAEINALKAQLDDLSRELDKITAALAGAGIVVEK